VKNILVVVGSGTKESTTLKLADAFAKGVSKKGHKVTIAFLGDKNVQGCKGCALCQDNGNKCVVNDDMQEIYSLYNECDTVVLASPLYFWMITARTKAFIDRLYALSKEHKYPAKDSYLLMTADDNEPQTFDQPVSYYQQHLSKALNWTEKGMYLAGDCRGGLGKSKICEKHLLAGYELGTKM